MDELITKLLAKVSVCLWEKGVGYVTIVSSFPVGGKITNPLSMFQDNHKTAVKTPRSIR